jgi:hypothetical protein
MTDAWHFCKRQKRENKISAAFFKDPIEKEDSQARQSQKLFM